MLKKLLLVLIPLFFVISLRAETFIWPVAKDAKGKSVMLAEVTGTSFNGVSGFPELDASLKNNKALNILNIYYKKLANVNQSSLPEAFYELDGSKEEIVSILMTNPNKYKGFSKVNKVDLLYSLNWGGYHFVNVKYITEQRGQFWRDIVACSGACKMSRAFNNIDSQRELFLHLNGQLSQISMITPLNQLSNKYSHIKSSVDNIVVNYFPDWKGAARSNTNPLSIYASINFRKPQIINVGQKTPQDKTYSGESDWNHISFKNFIEEARALGGFFDINSDETISKANLLISQHWKSYKPNQLIKGMRFDNSASSDVRIISEHYMPQAYVSLVSDWTKLVFVADFETSDYKFLYFYPLIGNELSALNVVPLEKTKDGLKLSYKALNSIVGKVLLSSDFVESVHKKSKLVIESVIEEL